jgi:Tol biopolymer transport system component
VRALKVPADFRYVAGIAQATVHIWLADLGTGAVVDAIQARAEPAFGPVFAASADGRRLVVAATGPSRHAALYAVDAEAGTSKLVYEDAELDAPGALSPVISRDGARLAFSNGRELRMLDLASSAVLRAIPHPSPQAVGGTWRAIAWSADGKWLALGRSDEATSAISIADTGSALRPIGAGTMASWRGRAPELLVMGGRSAFGGRSLAYTYDLATNRANVLEPDGAEMRSAAAWHPTEDRYLYVAAADPVPDGDVFTRGLADTAPARVGPRKVIDAWWSRDGSKIYGLVVRQDILAGFPAVANYEIAELPSGRIVATVCRGDARAACP